jgi:prophage tail gpP-like protein
MILEINDRIRIRRLNYFNKFEVNMKYDSLGSTFKFDFLFDPNNPEHKEMACIGHYHIAKLKEGKETLMTGYVLSEALNDYPEQQLVSIGGYSLPGVLQDCEIPVGEPTSWVNPSKGYAKNILNKTWPGTFQSNGLSLKEIAEKTIAPFGLQMVIDPIVADLMNETYDEITAKEKQSAKSYLCELAAQKNIIVTDDQHGRIVFTRPKANQSPVFHFQDNIPGTSMSLVFSGQGMHSHIRVVQQADVIEEIPSNEGQVENPFVPFVFRPHIAVQSSGSANDTLKAAKNLLAKELKNITLTIDIDRWNVTNKIIRPGQIISVTNPRVYLYKKSNWFVEEVNLKGDERQTIANLKCVLPCVYDGSTPKYLWEGINLH